MSAATSQGLIPDLAAARQLFQAIDQIHLVSIDPEGRAPTAGHDFGTDAEAAIEWATIENGKVRNVYWTVNRVRDRVHKKPEKADLTAARFAHLDIDPPRDGTPWDRAGALADLQALNPQPSMIIDSGNGLQAFWRLDDGVAPLEIEAINAALIAKQNGDRGTQNCDRPMRVPGFVNFPSPQKRAKGRVPVLSGWILPDNGELFTLAELGAAFTPAPARGGDGGDRRVPRISKGNGTPSPIERFNAENSISVLLAKYGYTRKGGSNDYRSPNQTSGSFATRDFGEHWVSWSASDLEAGLGVEAKGGGCFGDAFDLFVHYDHGGDRKAALDALGSKGDGGGGDSDGASGSGEASTTSPSAFHFVRVGDLKYRPPEFLIEGMLETESLGMIFGDPGSGKSFVAVDLALSVATGTPFHGRAVRQGPVFLIAGEGHNGLTRRFAAWSLHRGVSIESAPLFVSNRPAQFLDAASAASVTEAVQELAAQYGKPALIEIDTLARNYGPGDENSTSDMSAFVAAMDDLKAEFSGCAVALVHHTGHGDKKRARGAIALKGALDWEYLVEKSGEAIVLTGTKMKEAELPKPVAFALDNVTLRDGASSAALRETEAPVRTTKLKGKDEVAMAALTEALEKYGRTGMGGDYPAGVKVVSIDQWRSACAAHGLTSGSSDSAARTAFKRAKDRLIDLDLVRGFNDHFWKVRGDD